MPEQTQKTNVKNNFIEKSARLVNEKLHHMPYCNHFAYKDQRDRLVDITVIRLSEATIVKTY